jgi:hypothetical protein
LRIPHNGLSSAENYLHISDNNFNVILKTADGTTISGSYHQIYIWVQDYGATSVVEESTIKVIIPAESLAISGAKYIRLSSHVSTTLNSDTFDLALHDSLDNKGRPENEPTDDNEISIPSYWK